MTLPARPHFRSWVRTLALSLLLAMLGIALVVIGVASAVMRGYSVSGTFSHVLGVALCIACIIALRVALLRRRQLVDDLRALEAMAAAYTADLDDPARRPGALYRLAQFAFLRASRHGAWFDLDLWERATGDCCPRTIITAPGIDLEPVEAVAEEIDAASETSVSRGRVIRDVAAAIVLMIWGALILVMRPDLRVPGGLMAAGGLIAFLLAARRAGWRPIAIRSAIVSLRGIETGGFAGSQSFTVHDSMLFLYDQYQDRGTSDQRLAVRLLRADGARRTIRLTGREDPRIPGIIARWTAGSRGPGAAAPSRASATTTLSDSDPDGRIRPGNRA